MGMGPDAWLLHFEVAVALVAARTCVALSSTQLPFKLLNALSLGRRFKFSSSDAHELSSAVGRCARLMPGDYVCLPQALAASFLFWNRRLPLQVFVGVKKGPADEVEAHAWTKSGEFQVTGACDEFEYQVLRKWGLFQGA